MTPASRREGLTGWEDRPTTLWRIFISDTPTAWACEWSATGKQVKVKPAGRVGWGDSRFNISQLEDNGYCRTPDECYALRRRRLVANVERAQSSLENIERALARFDADMLAMQPQQSSHGAPTLESAHEPTDAEVGR